jgi:hypothetical protein
MHHSIIDEVSAPSHQRTYRSNLSMQITPKSPRAQPPCYPPIRSRSYLSHLTIFPSFTAFHGSSQYAVGLLLASCRTPRLAICLPGALLLSNSNPCLHRVADLKTSIGAHRRSCLACLWGDDSLACLMGAILVILTSSIGPPSQFNSNRSQHQTHQSPTVDPFLPVCGGRQSCRKSVLSADICLFVSGETIDDVERYSTWINIL